MTYLIAYVAVLIVFGTIDAVWLTTMGALLYRPALGDILAQSLRVVPAIAFYLTFPIGIVVFAVMPGRRAVAGDGGVAIGRVGLFSQVYKCRRTGVRRMNLRSA